jgi:lactate dehydrogenase-like 2-hydroxyacid dehydrogenase
MTQADVLVTARLTDDLFEPIARAYRCHHFRSPDGRELDQAVARRVRAVVQEGAWVAAPAFLDTLPALEIIAVFGVGYDGIPLAYCGHRGIAVTNTPDVLTDDVADIALALVLMTARRLGEMERFVRSGAWRRGTNGPRLAATVGGKRAGILGLGRIGTAIAHRLEACRMQIAYTGRKPQDVGWPFVADLRELASASDFLVVACPGGAATRHLVDAGVLAALGPHGTLVNIARGSIVDEQALVAALQAGTLGAAGLDVFENEPNVPASLLALENVVLLPHVGSSTRETRRAMGELCKANLDRWFAARTTLTPVPEVARQL